MNQTEITDTMTRNVLLLTAAVLALTAGGCSTLRTRPLGAKSSLNPKNAAVQYYLPKGVITVSVIQTETVQAGKSSFSWRLSPSDVSFVPDTSQPLGLYYLPKIFAEDAVTVGVSSKGLLSK